MAGRSRGQHMPPQQPSKQTAIAPPTKPKKQKAHNTHRVAPEHVKESPKPKTPRAVSPEAACVSDHSRGQDLPPATALRTNDNNTPTIVIPDIISRKRKENIRNLRRQAGMTPHWRECEAPLRRTRRHGAATEKGGLSGRPLFSRAVEVIGILRESLPAGAMLIGSWGGGGGGRRPRALPGGGGFGSNLHWINLSRPELGGRHPARFFRKRDLNGNKAAGINSRYSPVLSNSASNFAISRCCVETIPRNSFGVRVSTCTCLFGFIARKS